MSQSLASPVTLPADAVTIIDGHAVTTSIAVAKVFGKRHFNVLRDIERLECSAEFRASNFECMTREVTIGNGGTRTEPYVNLTRDALAIVAFGYTGRLAMRFKEAYIARFNAMEQATQQPLIERGRNAAKLEATANRAEAALAENTQKLAKLEAANRAQRALQRRAWLDPDVQRFQRENLRLHASLHAAHLLILRDPLLADIAEWHHRGLSAAKLAKLHDTTDALVADLATQVQAAGLVLNDITRAGFGLARNALVALDPTAQ